MQHLLRAISGPQAGATYVLGQRTTIGRASDCDIQIVHEGVSRHHAKITLQDDGTLMVSDLSSDNGTYINGEKITRHRLLPGHELRIMRSRFTYEQLRSSDVVTSSVFRRKITSGDSLRQTADHGKVISTIRAEVAKQGGIAGERARPHSRPQAAAPAPSGARPGAAGPSEETADASEEPMVVRRPGPGVGAARASGVKAEPAAPTSSQAERWLGRRTSPTQEHRPLEYTGQTAALPRQPTGATVHRKIVHPRDEPGPAVAEQSASYGWTVSRDTARRGPVARGTPSRTERPPVVAPAGRMAPSAPSAATPTATEPSASPAAPRAPVEPTSAGAPAHPSASGGWARVPRPVESPRSMRPGNTLAGVRRVSDESTSSSSSPIAPAEGRSHQTAEYGRMADDSAPSPSAEPRDAEAGASPTRPPSGRPSAARPGMARPSPRPMPAMPVAQPLPVKASRPASSPSPAAVPRPALRPTPAAPNHADSDEGDEAFDRMRTLPSIKRIEGPPSADARPDVRARSPHGAGSSEGPAPADAAAQSPEVESIDAPQQDDVVYEDTLRYELPDERTGGSSPEVAAPEPLQPMTSDELIDALEQADRQHEREGLGSLVDILEYRELRLRSLRGDAVEGDRERLAQLQQQLQQEPLAGHDTAAMRRYHRFACSISAQLTHTQRGVTSTITVEVEDLSAGGAKVTFGEYSLEAGDVVWIAFDLSGVDRSSTVLPEADSVVFKARVVWARPHQAQVGLIFAGAPRYGDEAAVELEP